MQTIERSQAVSEQSTTIRQWEYTVAPLCIHAYGDGAGPQLSNATEIDGLGQAGWELVSVAVYPPYASIAGVFKRPTPSQQRPDPA